MTGSNGPQLDLSAQVAKVKARTRPWKSIIALALAIAAAATSAWARASFHAFFTAHDVPKQIIAAATAAAFFGFGIVATIGLSAKAEQVVDRLSSASHASVVRYALLLIGGITTLIITLVLFSVPVGQLLVGGALTSVFIGIAAQQALGNVFAGMVLLLAHPFRVGDSVRFQAGALWGQLDGTVIEIGITYIRLDTASRAGVLSIPNSLVLNAVVGPRPAPTPDPPAVT
jgi:small-conductance mechanosensitive channel